MRGRKSILSVLAALALMLGTGAVRAEPVTIRMGWVVVPASLQPILFAKPSLAKHLGKSYAVDLVHFKGTSPEVTALAAGDIDIAPLAFSSLGAAIENAKMNDLRIIFDQIRDGRDGYYSTEFMVAKDGPIKTVEDLKGKVLATNTVGAAVDIAMRAMLQRRHLEARRDYSVVEAPFPTMKAMLAEHKADLITAVPPFAYDPALRGAARTLFTMKDALGTTQLTFWVARAGFLEKNHAAVADLLEDALRAVRWYIAPEHHEEAVDIVAQFTKRPRRLYESWLFTKKDYYRDPNGVPNLDAIQRSLDAEKRLGFLKTDIDVKKFADLSFVEAAAKRLQ